MDSALLKTALMDGTTTLMITDAINATPPAKPASALEITNVGPVLKEAASSTTSPVMSPPLLAPDSAGPSFASLVGSNDLMSPSVESATIAAQHAMN